MDKAPRGVRLPEDEPLFREPSDDKTISPDTVSPAVEGYFRVPAIWVGEEPSLDPENGFNPQVCQEVVFEKNLNAGIGIRVLRDGTFLFDFSSWELAPQVEIPGYRHQGPGIPHRLPVVSEKAVQASEDYAVVRARAMNVHQACMATSVHLITGGSHQMGYPVDAMNTLKGLTFNEGGRFRDSDTDVSTMARNIANNRYKNTDNVSFSRRVFDQEIVEKSFEILDQILLRSDMTLLQMIESVYVAAHRFLERRSGEAVVVAWTVCEQLLLVAWSSLLDDTKSSGRMTGRRRKKLEGRDYTASVMTEMLEINERIDSELYGRIEVARKARNNWVHRTLEPNNLEVSESIRAALDLLHEFKGVCLHFPLTGPGPGVPGWNAWIWERIKNQAQH